MSVQAIAWVIENSKHKESRLVVLLMIANHARSDGTGAWPSIPTIAKESRISVRACQYNIARLERSGELAVERGHGPHGTNLYSLPKMMGATSAPVVQLAVGRGATMLHPPGATIAAPEPSFNRPSKKERLRRKRAEAERKDSIRRYQRERLS